jgi:hypothetical protein
MHKPTPYKFRLAYFLFFVLVFIVGIPILVFYSAGYKIDETFGLSIRGGIYAYTPEPGTSVFIGNELKNTSGFFNKEVLVGGLKPEQYLVLATNEKYWPWAKIVNVKRGRVEALFPFLVPKVVEATEIESTDEDYEEFMELFEEKDNLIDSLTSDSSGRGVGSSGVSKRNVSNDVATSTEEVFDTVVRRHTEVWIDENKLYARWLGRGDAAPNYYCYVTVSPNNNREHEICSEPILVFSSSVPVRTFDFYPYRDDAIILALDNGVYAVENDFRAYQNFYPLYRGKDPDFRVYKNQVYVRDGDYLAVLNLEI